MDAGTVLERVVPILYFLVCLTVVAELADRMGLFEVLGRAASRISGGRVWQLWLIIAGVSVATTAVLSLDTTAVLVTPVALALIRRHRLPPSLFAWTTIWTANCASLLLPVANLTNLLALSHPQPTITAADWWPRVGPVGVICALVPLLVLAVRHRHLLASDLHHPEPQQGQDRVQVVAAGLVCTGLAVAFIAGAPITTAAGLGALILCLVCGWRRPAALELRILPWRTVLAVSVLFAVVTVLHDLGLTAWLVQVTGTGDGRGDHLRLAGTALLASNMINNLPAYLLLEPTAETAGRMIALLVGVNAGPLITPWASVATLLWANRCRAAGVPVVWRSLSGWGAFCAVLTVGAAVLVDSVLYATR